MITPRRTRLVRVPTLHVFRRVIGALAGADAPSDTLIIVPTHGAVRQLERAAVPDRAEAGGRAAACGRAVTRDDLYDDLHARLPRPPRRLSHADREAIAQAAARVAAERLTAQGAELPFRIRPGLVAEVLRFYDLLRRQRQHVNRFEELIAQALGSDVNAGFDEGDRGAVRMRQQTSFLAEAFRDYERRVADSGALDEHVLRERLIATVPARPAAHVIVTVPDWIADPDGLFVADFDLLTRLPQLAAVDVVCTEALLASGFHERLREWLPGIEELAPSDLGIAEGSPVRPAIVTPADAAPDQPWFTLRDREEELALVCRRPDRDAERMAVVYKRPLPYLYLAGDVFASAGLAWQSADARPLAAEPSAAALDLLLDLVETSFARDALVAVLRSPHFAWSSSAVATGAQVRAFDRALADARYLGDVERLRSFLGQSRFDTIETTLTAAIGIADELTPLLEPAAASEQIARVRAFFVGHGRTLAADDPLADRDARARAAVTAVLDALEAAHAAHDNPPWTIEQLAPAVRRWIEEQTFDAVHSSEGVHLLDDQAARYGEFDHVALVGLIEGEWPETPRRNIFYPPLLLRALGWPSERDRGAAADAHFLDLLASARQTVTLTTITLDEDALVTRSLQLDEVPRAQLSTIAAAPGEPTRVFTDERLAMFDADRDCGGLAAGTVESAWLAIRSSRPPADAPEYHGSAGALPEREWSVSAVETYLGCPFKFFAQHVLALPDEPEDEEIMDPRRQGQLVHTVFEEFFRAWQAAAHGAITPSNIEEARRLFVETVDSSLAGLSEAEAGIERTRLLGSPAAAGLGEAVFRMEAERSVGLVERLLEHRLSGAVTLRTSAGDRRVRLRGKADRIDLLQDGTFRLIDYKLGWPPQKARALQLAIYAVIAEERLRGYRGRDWKLGEAAYVAFKGPKRVVPLYAYEKDREPTLAAAQQRLSDALDAIARGEFPPTPDDLFRCESCGYAAVCRKDYVGDV